MIREFLISNFKLYNSSAAGLSFLKSGVPQAKQDDTPHSGPSDKGSGTNELEIAAPITKILTEGDDDVAQH
jgi:hypothetical protein